MNLECLKANNRAWAQRMADSDPDFFKRLEIGQAPEYLWIGCSDSRMPAEAIIDVAPGKLFVHRNLANLALPQDTSAGAVLQYAVDVIKVRHVLVVGHYGCGGVTAAAGGPQQGPVEDWLVPIRQTRDAHRDELDGISEPTARLDRLTELNVIQQVRNVARSVTAREAWARGQALGIHGWIYSLADGRVSDLGVSEQGPNA